MQIDFNRIEETYGKEVLKSIQDNKEDVFKNIKYFISRGFSAESAIDLFELNAIVFICNNDDFKEKLDRLINKLGDNYIDMVENDFGYLDELF